MPEIHKTQSEEIPRLIARDYQGIHGEPTLTSLTFYAENANISSAGRTPSGDSYGVSVAVSLTPDGFDSLISLLNAHVEGRRDVRS